MVDYLIRFLTKNKKNVICIVCNLFLVVKEPPYVVKESGYAGFPLPIEIYVRNKEEPRKIKFNYELILQDRGSPPISRVIREVYVFSPSEDFRRKLIKGGGVSIQFLLRNIANIYFL